MIQINDYVERLINNGIFTSFKNISQENTNYKGEKSNLRVEKTVTPPPQSGDQSDCHQKWEKLKLRAPQRYTASLL